MKQTKLIWLLIFVAAGIFLGWRVLTTDMGRIWHHPVRQIHQQGEDGTWSEVELSSSRMYDLHDDGDLEDNQVGWNRWNVIKDRKGFHESLQRSLASFDLDPELVHDPVAAKAAIEGNSSMNDAERETLQSMVYMSEDFELSPSRTVGVWISAFFTICIMSFLYRDNPLYKFAEAVVIGASAAYVMVIGFWTMLVKNLFSNLAPNLMRDTFIPGLPEDFNFDGWYLVPAIFIIFLLWRLMPKGGWISRWPLAFFIGITAGMRLLVHLEADFMEQISATMIPLWVTVEDAAGSMVLWDSAWASFTNIIIIGATLTGLVYFFFSVEHKGAVGGAARVGIWFLMITFGASFGYTVMGRIALLAERLQYLFGNWLHLTPPT